MTIRVANNSIPIDATNVVNYGADPTGVLDSSAAFNAAAAASNSIYAPPGTFLINSATVELAGKSLAGAGVDATTLKTSNANCAMLTITSAQGAGIRDLAISCSTTATSGSMVKIAGTSAAGGFSVTIRNVAINNAYNAIEITGSTSADIDHLTITQMLNAGIYAHDGPSAVALSHFVIYSTAASVTGIYLHNQVEGFAADNGNIIGCTFALYTDASALTRGSCPAFNTFTNVDFDTAHPGSGNSGVHIGFALGFVFTGCWFGGSSNGNGCDVGVSSTATYDISFVGCLFAANAQHGCSVQSAAVQTRFTNCAFIANSASSSTTYNGLDIAANTTDFVVSGSTATNTSHWPGGSGGGTQGTGIIVHTGTSDRYSIVNNLISSNATAGVTDGGSGSNKTVSSNF